MSENMCLHWERRPRSAEPRHRSLRLCLVCASQKGIRSVYRKRPGWTRERDRHIQALVERAKARLPLFEEPAAPGAGGTLP
jgi:hypothetical protein